MKSGIVRNTRGLVAQESVVGWVMSGTLVDDGGGGPFCSLTPIAMF